MLSHRHRTPRLLPRLLPVGLVIGAPASALAFPANVLEVPNGGSFGCALCHPGGDTTQLNPLGDDVKATYVGDDVSWTALYDVDSDGDCFTNGQELGDPSGLWRTGDANPATSPSHPALATSTPPVPAGSDPCASAAPTDPPSGNTGTPRTPPGSQTPGRTTSPTAMPSDDDPEVIGPVGCDETGAGGSGLILVVPGLRRRRTRRSRAQRQHGGA